MSTTTHAASVWWQSGYVRDVAILRPDRPREGRAELLSLIQIDIYGCFVASLTCGRKTRLV